MFEILKEIWAAEKIVFLVIGVFLFVGANVALIGWGGFLIVSLFI